MVSEELTLPKHTTFMFYQTSYFHFNYYWFNLLSMLPLLIKTTVGYKINPLNILLCIYSLKCTSLCALYLY